MGARSHVPGCDADGATLSRIAPLPPDMRVYYCAIVAAAAAIMIGYDSAFIGTSIALASFKKEFGLDTMTSTQFANESANIVGLPPRPPPPFAPR